MKPRSLRHCLCAYKYPNNLTSFNPYNSKTHSKPKMRHKARSFLSQVVLFDSWSSMLVLKYRFEFLTQISSHLSYIQPEASSLFIASTLSFIFFHAMFLPPPPSLLFTFSVKIAPAKGHSAYSVLLPAAIFEDPQYPL